jgi:5-formyltetrahydrofolate cyclo-ligase
MIQNKTYIRNQIAKLKSEYTFEEICDSSNKIMEQIEGLPAFKSSKRILIYYSIPGEVQTVDFLEKYKNVKELYLPVVEGSVLSVKKYTGKDNCVKGPFGILEPEGKCIETLNEVDLIVIPGVAFDRNGNRLGRGKGYYDKLLYTIPSTTLKAGICFDFQLLENIPVDPWDIQMNLIVTEKEVIYSC